MISNNDLNNNYSKPTTDVKVSIDQIKLTTSIFLTKDKVIEVRTSKTPRLGVQAGWFNNPNELVKSVQTLSGKVIVYLTHNPCNQALIARSNNRIKAHIEHTTSDKDILKREWIYTDFDPDRPADISSTNAEHEKAIKRAYQVYEYLQMAGFPADCLIVGDSGNGGHVLARVDLPNDNTSLNLIKRILKVLKVKFEADGILVDQAVNNASRIGKFYGTLTMKGENIPDRPWRIAKILKYPKIEDIKPVSTDILNNFAALIPDEPIIKTNSNSTGQKFNIVKFMTDSGLEVKREKLIDDGVLYELKVCPFNPEHNRGEACIIQFNNGALSFTCHHNGCNNYKWADLRDKYANNVNMYMYIASVTDKSTHERDKNVTDIVTGEAKSKSENVTGLKVTLSDRVLEWVKGTTGWFGTDEIDRDLGIISSTDKDNRRQIVLRLRDQGIIEPHAKINKQFRYVNTKITKLNFKTATDSGSLAFRWPFQIERLVNLYPGNIACIAGATNAGKTGLILNTIYLNQDKFPIYYICSEMGDIELRSRLDEFPGMDINDWKFEAIERASDFADVIRPDCVNIIDYLEMTDELYRVNEHLTAISHKIGSGIAIVALQKKENAKYGRGQEFSAEKTKLYLSLDKGKVTITKGKSWVDKHIDPQGLSIKFRISGGCMFKPETGWYDDTGKVVFIPSPNNYEPRTRTLPEGADF